MKRLEELVGFERAIYTHFLGRAHGKVVMVSIAAESSSHEITHILTK